MHYIFFGLLSNYEYYLVERIYNKHIYNNADRQTDVPTVYIMRFFSEYNEPNQLTLIMRLAAIFIQNKRQLSSKCWL